MKLLQKRKESIDLNVTPLIDVVFLLLIFFMVSTSFERQYQIPLTLPEANSTSPDKELDFIRISIDANNKIYVNGRPAEQADAASLRQLLEQESQDMPEPTIVIDADEAAQHQFVIRVIDTARQLKITKINLATQIADEAGT